MNYKKEVRDCDYERADEISLVQDHRHYHKLPEVALERLIRHAEKEQSYAANPKKLSDQLLFDTFCSLGMRQRVKMFKWNATEPDAILYALQERLTPLEERDPDEYKMGPEANLTRYQRHLEEKKVAAAAVTDYRARTFGRDPSPASVRVDPPGQP